MAIESDSFTSQNCLRDFSRLSLNFRDVLSNWTFNNNNNNNNNNLFIYSALFNILGDQKRITTINNLKKIQILEIYKYI